MFRRLPILAVGLALACAASVALAQSATVSAAPVVNGVEPLIVALANAIIAGTAVLAASLLQRWTGAKLDANALATATAWAQSHAGAAIAASASNLTTAQIDVGSPLVADIVTQMTGAIPSVLAAAGLTPDRVALLVAGEIGKLQARMTSVAPAPAAAK